MPYWSTGFVKPYNLEGLYKICCFSLLAAIVAVGQLVVNHQKKPA
jgi:hypothetical protein